MNVHVQGDTVCLFPKSLSWKKSGEKADGRETYDADAHVRSLDRCVKADPLKAEHGADRQEFEPRSPICFLQSFESEDDRPKTCSAEGNPPPHNHKGVQVYEFAENSGPTREDDG